MVDGTWDNFSDTINLQNWLKARGVYAKARECDGVWGYWTTLGIQQYLSTKYKGGYPREKYYPGRLDGQFGSMTKAAMGDAAYYLVGGRPGSKMYQYCGGYDCNVAWPNKEVVMNWQYFLNANT